MVPETTKWLNAKSHVCVPAVLVYSTPSGLYCALGLFFIYGFHPQLFKLNPFSI